MPQTRKKIQNEVIDLRAFRQLVKAYGQIASGRMKATREEVITARDFLSKVSEIFEEVRRGYAKEIARLAKKKGGKKGENITFLGNNGRAVAVFLSSNTGLYGDLVARVFRQFIKDVKETSAEATIVGKYGLSLLLNSEPNMPYTYFDFPDHGDYSGKLSDLIAHIVQYRDMNIYYGKFENMVFQNPNKLNLSAETKIESSSTKNHTNFLFEPDLDRILQFFEAEIFSSLFNQTIGESRLAKFASRVIAMDKAEENIKDNLKFKRIEMLKATHNAINKKQLNSLASVFHRSR